jgi:hypothetical protein
VFVGLNVCTVIDIVGKYLIVFRGNFVRSFKLSKFAPNGSSAYEARRENERGTLL